MSTQEQARTGERWELWRTCGRWHVADPCGAPTLPDRCRPVESVAVMPVAEHVEAMRDMAEGWADEMTLEAERIALLSGGVARLYGELQRLRNLPAAGDS
jgi:hypothetical protein